MKYGKELINYSYSFPIFCGNADSSEQALFRWRELTGVWGDINIDFV